MKALLQAISFLTILPVGIKHDLDEKELAASMGFFPFVGLLIGMILALSYYLLSFIFPKPIVLWFIIGITVFITRGLHLDGFADTMDGLFSMGSKERILEVMRDPRIGVFGALSLILLIGAKYIILNQISNSLIPTSLILMTVIGRSSIVLVCYRSPYARSGEGLAKPFTTNLKIHQLALSIITAIGIVLWIMGIRGILIFFAIGLFSLSYRFFFIKKLAGVTGDILGGVNEFAELLCIILLIIFEK